MHFPTLLPTTLLLSSLSLIDAWDVNFYSDDACGALLSAASGEGASTCAAFPSPVPSVEILSMDPGCFLVMVSDSACILAHSSAGFSDEATCENSDTTAIASWGSYYIDCSS